MNIVNIPVKLPRSWFDQAIIVDERVPRDTIACMPRLPREVDETDARWRDRCVAASVWIVNVRDTPVED